MCRSPTSAARDTAVEDDRSPGSWVLQWEGDRPRSPKCRVQQNTFASCNTAVEDPTSLCYEGQADRPPMHRVAQREDEHSW